MNHSSKDFIGMVSRETSCSVCMRITLKIFVNRTELQSFYFRLSHVHCVVMIRQMVKQSLHLSISHEGAAVRGCSKPFLFCSAQILRVSWENCLVSKSKTEPLFTVPVRFTDDATNVNVAVAKPIKHTNIRNKQRQNASNVLVSEKN